MQQRIAVDFVYGRSQIMSATQGWRGGLANADKSGQSGVGGYCKILTSAAGGGENAEIEEDKNAMVGRGRQTLTKGGKGADQFLTNAEKERRKGPDRP